MKLVIDANVVISALIADSKTRELIVTLEPDLLTPAFVYDEIENYEGWSSWISLSACFACLVTTQQANSFNLHAL
jgi:predicted nucleic acid-binding protein